MHTNPVSAAQRLMSAQQRCDRTNRAQHALTPLTLTLGNRSLRCSTSRIPAVVSQRERGFLKERGTALIFALVMLLLLTLLGITAVTTSSLQEKMAGNMRDQYTAQQGGDSILRDGEALVYDQASRPTPTCPPSTAVTQRVWDSSITSVGNPSCLTDVATATDSWWSGFGYLSAVTNNNTSQQPRYVVEFIQRVEEPLGQSPKKFRYYYRTTGWSVGFTDSAKALLQSVFSKKTDDYSTP